jgi:hypothetical protein
MELDPWAWALRQLCECFLSGVNMHPYGTASDVTVSAQRVVNRKAVLVTIRFYVEPK